MLAVTTSGIVAVTGTPTAAEPVSVTIAEASRASSAARVIGSPSALSRLALDAEDGVWQAMFAVPAGAWEHRAALNGTWDENYGLGAVRDGQHPAEPRRTDGVKFYYDHATHWVTDREGSGIAGVPRPA